MLHTQCIISNLEQCQNLIGSMQQCIYHYLFQNNVLINQLLDFVFVISGKERSLLKQTKKNYKSFNSNWKRILTHMCASLTSPRLHQPHPCEKLIAYEILCFIKAVCLS